MAGEVGGTCEPGQGFARGVSLVNGWRDTRRRWEEDRVEIKHRELEIVDEPRLLAFRLEVRRSRDLEAAFDEREHVRAIALAMLRHSLAVVRGRLPLQDRHDGRRKQFARRKLDLADVLA